MDEKTRSKWGYTFQWTVNHISREAANPMRYEYDKLGAAALSRLQEISIEDFRGEGKAINRGKVDHYALLQDKYPTDPVLSEFWHELHTVPAWVDWEQIARGQEFFYRYAVANITGFALQGFVGENSAASGVVEVFVRTGGFSTKVLLYRLMETFQWLIQITHELSSIQPGGEGHASTIRVRLLQASVRQRILKLVQTRPEYFNAEKYGVPVNNLDSVHSICVFCCNPMWFQLPKMGIAPKKQEIADYIALFRYVAYLLATPTQYFETPEKAKAVMESMYLNELEPSEISKIVGHNFVKCLEDLPPFNISRDFMEAGSRWINGDALCDALDLGRPGRYYYALMTGLSWIVRSVAFLQKTIPSFDRFIVAYFRKTLYQSIILSRSGVGGPTVFEFKYVPQIGKKTGKEGLLRQCVGSEAPQPKRLVERFLLLGFVIGCVLQAVIIISGLAVGMQMWQRL